jgi:hypothetical protein
VLTSTAKHVLDDSNNLMAVHTATAGTFLNSSQCQSIHTRARSL